uniref:Protein TsetseEP domain-containing protein n=1 Tax=Glossina brevipalpis TaxID=37001 RepID=A0A1A9X172_9MUSC
MSFIKILIAVAATISTLKVYAGKSKYNNETLTIDSYIEFYKRQHSAKIRNFKTRLQTFLGLYEHNFEIIQQQGRFLHQHMQFLEHNLYPMEYLSRINKHCIARYHGSIPSITTFKDTMELCVEMAKVSSKNLLDKAQRCIDQLKEYYDTIFLSAAANIRNVKDNAMMLLDNEVLKANEYTFETKNRFDNELQSAEYLAGTFIKFALNCSLSVHFNAAFALVEVKSKIQSCLRGHEFCACKDSYACNNVREVNATVLNAKIIVSSNDVDSGNKSKTCILLKTETKPILINITRNTATQKRFEEQNQGAGPLPSSLFTQQTLGSEKHPSSLVAEQIQANQILPSAVFAQQRIPRTLIETQMFPNSLTEQTLSTPLLERQMFPISLGTKQMPPSTLFAQQNLPSSSLVQQAFSNSLLSQQTPEFITPSTSAVVQQDQGNHTPMSSFLPQQTMEATTPSNSPLAQQRNPESVFAPKTPEFTMPSNSVLGQQNQEIGTLLNPPPTQNSQATQMLPNSLVAQQTLPISSLPLQTFPSSPFTQQTHEFAMPSTSVLLPQQTFPSSLFEQQILPSYPDEWNAKRSQHRQTAESFWNTHGLYNKYGKESEINNIFLNTAHVANNALQAMGS